MVISNFTSSGISNVDVAAIATENLEYYGIGHNFTAAIYPQDIEYVVYGEALDDAMAQDAELRLERN